jgi:hypothetical protein
MFFRCRDSVVKVRAHAPEGLGSDARPLAPAQRFERSAPQGRGVELPLEKNRPGTSPGRRAGSAVLEPPYSDLRFAFVSVASTHHLNLVEMRGFEPLTSALQKQRSPS